MSDITHRVDFEDGGSLNALLDKAEKFYSTVGEGTEEQKKQYAELIKSVEDYNKSLTKQVKVGTAAATQVEKNTAKQQLLNDVQGEFTERVEEGLGPLGKYANLLRATIKQYTDSAARAKQLSQEIRNQAGADKELQSAKSGTLRSLARTRVAGLAVRAALGTLAVGVGILAVGFSRNQELVDKFNVALAGVRAVVGSVLDSFGDLAGAIVNIVTLDFAGAWGDVKNAVSGVTTELVDNVRAATEAERSLQSLRSLQLNYTLSLSASRDELIALDQVINDSNATYEDRIAAVQESSRIETQLSEERIRLAEQELRANLKSTLSQEEFNAAVRDLEDASDSFDSSAEKAQFLSDKIQALSSETLSPTQLQDAANQIVANRELSVDQLEAEVRERNEIEALEEERRDKYRRFVEERKKAEADLAKFREGITSRLNELEASNLQGEERISFERRIADEEINQLERVAREKFAAINEEFDLEEEFAQLREGLAADTEKRISENRLLEARERIADEQEFAELQLQQISTIAEEGLTLEESRQKELLDIRRNGLKQLREIALQEFGEGSLEVLRLDVEIGEVDATNATDSAATVQRLLNERLAVVDNDKAIQLAQLELVQERVDKELTLEQNKERERLNILVDSLADRREILVEQFGGENAPEIRLLDLEVEKLQQDIDAIGNLNLDPIDKIKLRLQEAFNLSDADVQLLTDQVGSIAGNILSGFDALREARLSENAQTIATIDEQINELSAELEIAEERAAQGYANNAAALRASLEEQTAARTAAEEERLEIEKRAARQRLIQESAQQVSSLALAAARLLASEASKGVVGLILAASGIATIFSIAARAKAQAAEFNQVPEFREGGSIANGLLLGASHEGGGIPATYSDNLGRTRMVSLEGDEFVTSKAQTAKYQPVLEAINSGAIEGMNQDGLRNLFSKTPIPYTFGSVQSVMANGGREVVLNRGMGTDSALAKALGSKLDLVAQAIESQEQVVEKDGKFYRVDKSNAVPRMVKM